MGKRLGIGFVGAGFMNRFHAQSLVGVRDCDVTGVFSPTRKHAEELAASCRELGIAGDVHLASSVTEQIGRAHV